LFLEIFDDFDDRGQVEAADIRDVTLALANEASHNSHSITSHSFSHAYR
jgi:hypothetical protein